MKTNKSKACFLFIAITSFLMTGCYKEEHFDMPGPFALEQRIPVPLPFPFDTTRNAGVWLVKDGVPDEKKVLFKGYTDYVAVGDAVSWVRKADGVQVIPHTNYNPLSNADHFNGDVLAYQSNFAYSKYFVPIGAGRSFYMYSKVTFGTFNATAASLQLGKHTETGGNFVFGLDGGSSGEPQFFLDIYGVNGVSVNPDLGWPTIIQVMRPGVPAEIEAILAEGIFYVKVNGVLVFQFKVPADKLYYYTPAIRPWRNFIKVHDMYLESDGMYTLDYAMHEYEKGYNKIQAPALAKANNGDLLLFAEGRSAPLNAKERITQNLKPVGNTDIIMKRSTDGGSTWSDQLVVLAGDNSGSTYCFPQVVSSASGKMILHYSKIDGAFAATTNVYTYNAATQQVFQIESSDNGQTWSTPVDISAVVKIAGSTYVQSGPGHGIELTSTAYKNRLVMPLTYSNNTVRVAYSSNAGQTWTLSPQVAGTTYKFPTIVELADGRLMMTMSNTAATPRTRKVSYSTNGGQTWSAATDMDASFSTGDFGHSYAGVAVKGNAGEIIMVTPTSRELDSESKNTVHFPVTPVMYKSVNNGASFTSMGPLHTKTTYYQHKIPYGFMDAVVLDNGEVVIAGEGGVESPAEGIVIYKK